MSKGKPVEKRGLHITFYCTVEEYKAIRELSRKTTTRSFSEYARKMLLGEPITVLTRDVSLDELTTVLNGLRNELERLLDHRAFNAEEKPQLKMLVETIKKQINKIAEQCILK